MWRNAQLTNKALDGVAAVARALADENRLRALAALNGRELCVCQIVEMLELAPSTVSKHMSILRQAGLVEARKQGRWVYYRLADQEGAPEPVAGVLAWLFASLEGDGRIATDAERLDGILCLDPEELCRKHLEN